MTTVSSCGPPFHPAVHREQLGVVVGLQDRHVRAPQAQRGAIRCAPERDEVAVEAQDPVVRARLGPVQADLIVEPAVLEQLLALEQHRDAGRGQHQRRPEGQHASSPTSCRRRPGRSPPGRGSGRWRPRRATRCRSRVPAAPPDLSPRIAVTTSSMSRAPSSDATTAPRTRWTNSTVPLGAEAGAALVGRCDQGRIVLHVLGDRDLPRLAGPDLVVSKSQAMNDHPSSSAEPSLFGSLSTVPDVHGGVEAEAVASKLLEQGHRAVAPEGPRTFAAAVVGSRRPQRHRPHVWVDVRPHHPRTSRRTATGRDQDRPEVVVDDVDGHARSRGRGRRERGLERVGPAVAGLDGEQVRRVVAPGDAARELARGITCTARRRAPEGSRAGGGRYRMCRVDPPSR